MTVRMKWRAMRWLFAGIVTVAAGASMRADTVAVAHTEGIVHGFLALSTLDGTVIADGELLQTAAGDRVTTRLVFHFKDGSVHDETAVYTQRRVFHLVSDHLTQKGPSFPQPLDVTIEESGRVTVKYEDKGTPKTEVEQLELPPDLANGMLLTLLKNVRPDAPRTSVSFLAATPKPRLVKVDITPAGQDPFTLGAARKHATHFVLKVDIGGLSGLIAPLIGKQPPDSHVWILGGDVPAFVKSEQFLYFGGPTWRIELVAPRWPAPVKLN
jgi:hypothetical protein